MPKLAYGHSHACCNDSLFLVRSRSTATLERVLLQTTADYFYYALVPCGAGLKSNGGTVNDPPAIDFAFGTVATADRTFTFSADEYSLPPSPCPSGYFMDCGGTCIKSGGSIASWIGDGECDDGAYGYFFNCPAFGCDGGDCVAAKCKSGDPGEMCMFGLSPDEGMDTYVRLP